MSEKAVRHLYWIGGHISSDKAQNSGHFGHYRFPISVANWQFLIKVSTYVILLVENNARISKSPPSLNAAVWGEGDGLMGQRLDLNRTTCGGVCQSCRLGNMMSNSFPLLGILPT